MRVEEFVNSFEQDYEPPAEGEGAFAIHLEGAPSPYGGERYHLPRVGIQGCEVPAEERKAGGAHLRDRRLRLDGRENRLGLVKQALQLLVEELRPTDRVGIVVYGSDGRVLLEPTAVATSGRILRAIDHLQPEGSTNAEEGLRLGYDMAGQGFRRPAPSTGSSSAPTAWPTSARPARTLS